MIRGSNPKFKGTIVLVWLFKILSDNVIESTQAAIQIGSSSKEQLVGMDQLALGMDNIKEASSQNMESAKQLESATKGLKDLGLKINDLVGSFKV